MDDDDMLEALQALAAARAAARPCCICGVPTLDAVEFVGHGVFPYCEKHEREAFAALARSGGASDELANEFMEYVHANPDKFAGPEAN